MSAINLSRTFRSIFYLIGPKSFEQHLCVHDNKHHKDSLSTIIYCIEVNKVKKNVARFAFNEKWNETFWRKFQILCSLFFFHVYMALNKCLVVVILFGIFLFCRTSCVCSLVLLTLSFLFFLFPINVSLAFFRLQFRYSFEKLQIACSSV